MLTNELAVLAGLDEDEDNPDPFLLLLCATNMCRIHIIFLLKSILQIEPESFLAEDNRTLGPRATFVCFKIVCPFKFHLRLHNFLQLLQGKTLGTGFIFSLPILL